MPACPSRWNKLRQFGLFANHGETWSFADLGPFAPAFGFSARFGGSGRSTQLRQQFRQASSHLLGGSRSLLVFPPTQFWLDQRTRQHQMIMGQGDDVAPALKLLRRPQARFLPEPRLLVQTVAVFLPKAQRVAQCHLRQISVGITYPDKPTHPWVALLSGRMRTYDANDRHIEPASFFDMQMLPPTDLDAAPFGIGPFKASIRLCMGRRVLGLQVVPIFSPRPSLASGRRSGSIEASVAFETAQDANIQLAELTPQPGGIIAAIQQQDQRSRQERSQVLDLLDGHLACGLIRGHTVLIENGGPTAWAFWQDDQRRKLPPKGDGLLAFWQVVHLDGASIRRGSRTGTGNITGVYRYPHAVPCRWSGGIVCQDPSQAVALNASILKGFVQTWPLAHKTWRERQFGKRLRPILGDQRIHRVEQSIFGSQKAVRDPVTKLFQCVKVHVRKLLRLVSGTLRVWLPFRKGWRLFVHFSLNVKLLKEMTKKCEGEIDVFRRKR
jgi:hypothetical protein